MISRADFVSAVRKIADSEPAYRTGGTGSDGTCDCVGLVMGAMYRNGRKTYDLHSSNYFARFQTESLQLLVSQDQLLEGDIVYKARDGEGQLHERYLPGGRYHTGDPLDYYHAGVVASVAPFCVTHCTSAGGVSGIVREESADGWTHFGHVKGVGETPAGQTAVVTAPSGRTVNLRSRPDVKSPVVMRVPVGQRVTVREQTQDWACVTAQEGSGYMMTAFLVREEQADETVPVPRETLLSMIDTLRSWL